METLLRNHQSQWILSAEDHEQVSWQLIQQLLGYPSEWAADATSKAKKQLDVSFTLLADEICEFPKWSQWRKEEFSVWVSK